MRIAERVPRAANHDDDFCLAVRKARCELDGCRWIGRRAEWTQNLAKRHVTLHAHVEHGVGQPGYR